MQRTPNVIAANSVSGRRMRVDVYCDDANRYTSGGRHTRNWAIHYGRIGLLSSFCRCGGPCRRASDLLIAFGIGPPSIPSEFSALGILAEPLHATGMILWIILPALLLYDYQQHSGGLETDPAGACPGDWHAENSGAAHRLVLCTIHGRGGRVRRACCIRCATACWGWTFSGSGCDALAFWHAAEMPFRCCEHANFDAGGNWRATIVGFGQHHCCLQSSFRPWPRL